MGSHAPRPTPNTPPWRGRWRSWPTPSQTDTDRARDAFARPIGVARWSSQLFEIHHALIDPPAVVATGATATLPGCRDDLRPIRIAFDIVAENSRVWRCRGSSLTIRSRRDPAEDDRRRQRQQAAIGAKTLRDLARQFAGRGEHEHAATSRRGPSGCAARRCRIGKATRLACRFRFVRCRRGRDRRGPWGWPAPSAATPCNRELAPSRPRRVVGGARPPPAAQRRLRAPCRSCRPGHTSSDPRRVPWPLLAVWPLPCRRQGRSQAARSVCRPRRALKASPSARLASVLSSVAKTILRSYAEGGPRSAVPPTAGDCSLLATCTSASISHGSRMTRARRAQGTPMGSLAS